jgi:ribonuclease G
MPEAVRASSSTAARPLFELYGVEAEISRALDRQVHRNPAATSSSTRPNHDDDRREHGRLCGQPQLEDTVFRTNLEAAVAIARQLRLRNLGGIIVIDFIDMQDEAHREQPWPLSRTR